MGDAEGTSVNLPLPPYAGDAAHPAAVDRVIGPAVRRFRPEVVVMMTGVDPHHTDPMAHLQVTTAAFPRLYAMPRDIAWDAARGRWLVVTGGGYDIDLLPRLWAMQLAAMLEVDLPEDLPADWLAMAEERAGRPFTPLLHGDTPLQVDEGMRASADAQAFELIESARGFFGLSSG